MEEDKSQLLTLLIATSIEIPSLIKGQTLLFNTFIVLNLLSVSTLLLTNKCLALVSAS